MGQIKKHYCAFQKYTVYYFNILGEEELSIYEYLAFLSAYPEIFPEVTSDLQQNEVSF